MNGKAEGDKVYPINKPPGTMLQKPPGYNLNKPPVYRSPFRTAVAPPRRRKRNLCCLCCIYTSIVILCLILILGVAGVAFYYIFRPQAPSFSVTDLKVSRLNVTTSKAGDTHLAAEVTVRIQARNPNKNMGFSFDQSSLVVSYPDPSREDDFSMGSGTYPPFLLDKKNSTTIKLDLKSQSNSVSSSTAKNLKSAFDKKKLRLKIQFETHVRAVIKKWKSGKVKITVNCEQVSATTSGKDNKCKIKFFKFPWFHFK